MYVCVNILRIYCIGTIQIIYCVYLCEIFDVVNNWIAWLHYTAAMRNSRFFVILPTMSSKKSCWPSIHNFYWKLFFLCDASLVLHVTIDYMKNSCIHVCNRLIKMSIYQLQRGLIQILCGSIWLLDILGKINSMLHSCEL